MGEMLVTLEVREECSTVLDTQEVWEASMTVVGKCFTPLRSGRTATT